MRVLFVNAYFMPETIAFSHLEKDLIDGLVAAGHEIEVICPTPTRGVTKEVRERYQSIKREDLYGGKVHVRRFFAPRERKDPLTRAFRYFWCNFREYQIGKKYKNIDAVFAVSTPPTQGLLAGKLSKKLNCPFVFSLQDIFPDSLVTTGLVKEGSLIWKIGRKIEDKTYRCAERIIVISNSCKQNLLKKGVPEDKLSLISNWIDLDKVRPVDKKDNTIFDEFEIQRETFNVLYAGNFGEAQGAQIVLDVADALKEEKRIHFVIFGSGVHFDEAAERAKAMVNVSIHSLLPMERVSEVYSLGDVALITCKPGAGGSAMPSKTWSIMACNTPVIASFDTTGDLAEVLTVSGAGSCVTPGSVDELKYAVLSAFDDWEKGRVSNLDLRAYVEKNASKDICVGKYVWIIKTAVKAD